MERIIRVRGTGKTKELMEQAYLNNGIFVCQNARHMREKAVAYGFTHLNIMSYEEFRDNIQEYDAITFTLKGYKDPEGRKFYIDELEDFVSFICLNTLGGYSLSLE